MCDFINHKLLKGSNTEMTQPSSILISLQRCCCLCSKKETSWSYHEMNLQTFKHAGSDIAEFDSWVSNILVSLIAMFFKLLFTRMRGFKHNVAYRKSLFEVFCLVFLIYHLWKGLGEWVCDPLWNLWSMKLQLNHLPLVEGKSRLIIMCHYPLNSLMRPTNILEMILHRLTLQERLQVYWFTVKIY